MRFAEREARVAELEAANGELEQAADLNQMFASAKPKARVLSVEEFFETGGLMAGYGSDRNGD